MTGDASVRIDYDKVAKDKCLDGYKGYTTNSSLPDDRVIEEYGYLFMIERLPPLQDGPGHPSDVS